VVRDRHAAYFASAAVARWDVWNGAGWRDAVDWVEVELPNLRAAFRWSAGRGDVEIAADIAAHAAMLGVSVQLFEPVGWAEEIAEAAAQADIRRLPRVYTAAGYACFIGRPEQAVVATQKAQQLETDARYDPFFHGLAGLIEALSQVYAGHLDLYVEITGRLAVLPPPARALGLPAYVDGLQASGRVDEAMALADEALAAARAQENPYFIAYAMWIYGSAFAATDPTRALTVWREGLRYVQQHRVNFFVGFIARDAARLELVDADPEVALTMFDVAIESFQQAGAVAQLTITLASATSLFERIGRLDDACTLHGAISRQPGSDHHVPDLPHLAQRLATALGADRFRECDSAGSVMDLNDAARYARGQIQQARAALQRGSGRAERPGGLSRREVEVLCLAAQGLTTQDIATQLFISPKTADRHIQNVYTKIGVSNRVGAALWAVQHGVID
jgi:DNA-binding CsgD family transcriptional regulator